jgi:hypothetical protein
MAECRSRRGKAGLPLPPREQGTRTERAKQASL